MNVISLSWIFSGALFAIFLFVNLFHIRVFRPADRAKVVNGWFRAILGLSIVLNLAFTSRLLGTDPETIPRIYLALQTLIFSLVGLYVVLEIYAFVDHSIRIRVAMELVKAELTRAELIEKYEPAQSMRNRLDKLVAGKYLEVREGRYHLTEKGLWFTGYVKAAKDWLRSGPGG